MDLNYEKLLKQQILESFADAGFEVASDGQLTIPSQNKQTYRALHSSHRNEKLEQNASFLDKKFDSLKHVFASGTDISPSSIRPRLELINGEGLSSDIFRLATLLWSVPVSKGFGRRMRYLVWDEQNEKLIGIFALGDPVFNLRARDQIIGWSSEARKESLVNVMDAYVLGAIPPYNQILCGKLIASLIKSKEIYDDFKKKYSNRQGIISGKEKSPNLLLVTTTSSLGRSSIYNRLSLDGTKIFYRIGYSQGWGHFHLSDALFGSIKTYLNEIEQGYSATYNFGQGPNWRIRTIRKAFDKLRIDQNALKHGIKREIFLCEMVNNSMQVLLHGDKPNTVTLKKTSEISDLALHRWVIPRATRDETYKNWTLEDTFALLK